MSTGHRTPAEAKFWDQIAIAIAVAVCAKSKKAQGCAHYARDVADRLLAERRASAQADK